MTDSDISDCYWPTEPEWAPLPGFSRYEASHRGQIRNRRTGRALATTPDPDGRKRLNLYADDGTRPNVSVARCVLTAHDRPPEPGEEACHGLGGPADDRWPENIRWDDKAGNERDKIAAGTTPAPNPTYPCKDGCGALVISEGRRCLDCVGRVGEEAAAMLGRGVNLCDVAEHFGYTQTDWVWKLATKHGGCTLTKREALTQQPSFSQRVTARLVTLSRRRGWRSDAGDAS
jgi:hypothetical protein